MTNASVSITDYNAVPGDVGDQTAEIQAAIDFVFAAGGGSVLIPAGTFRITSFLTLYTGIELCGLGASSKLHLVNNSRSDAIRAVGNEVSPLGISDFAILRCTATRSLVTAGRPRSTAAV